MKNLSKGLSHTVWMALPFLLLAQVVAAGELYTPPLSGGPFSGGGSGDCALVNLGQSRIEVTIEVRASDGSLINDLDTFADPGEVTQAVTALFISTTGYCAFFFDGPAHKVRAGYYATGAAADNFPLISVVRAE